MSFFLLSWLFPKLALLCLHAGPQARGRERSQRCSSSRRFWETLFFSFYLAKGKVSPSALIAHTAPRCIYTFITFPGPRQREGLVLGRDEEHKLSCCNFYSCFLFNGTNCILCRCRSGRKVTRRTTGPVQNSRARTCARLLFCSCFSFF